MRSATLTERKPPPTGVVIGPFSATPCLADDVERLLGQRIAAVLVHHVGAGLADVPVELDAGRLEDAARRLGQLGSGAVTGDQRHSMGHGGAWYLQRRRLRRLLRGAPALPVRLYSPEG